MKIWLNPGPYELPDEWGRVEDWMEMSSDIATALLDEDAIALFEAMCSNGPIEPTEHPLRRLIAKVE